jgi:hypothetical protein
LRVGQYLLLLYRVIVDLQGKIEKTVKKGNFTFVDDFPSRNRAYKRSLVAVTVRPLFEEKVVAAGMMAALVKRHSLSSFNEMLDAEADQLCNANRYE